MNKHTPGPWIVEGVEIYGGTPRKHVVWELGNDNPADARLIAAAPDLLEALTMVRDADEDCQRDGLPRTPEIARRKIEAVIAKAEGR